MLENLVTSNIRFIGKLLLVDQYSDLPREILIEKIKEKQIEIFKIAFIEGKTCKNFNCFDCPIRQLCAVLDEEINHSLVMRIDEPLKDSIAAFMDFSRYDDVKLKDDENLRELLKLLNDSSTYFINGGK